MNGRLIGIARTRELRAPMEEAQTAAVSVETGIAGDARGRKMGRQVTVLFREGWEEACRDLGVSLPWTTRRANLYVEGLDRPRNVGGRISIGGVMLEVTQETKPCMLMEQFHEGLKGTLTPDWRAGVCCNVISGGEISIGDKVELFVTPHDVIAFWEGVGEKKWFAVDPKLDAEIRERFEPQWRKARDGKLPDWKQSAEGTLGLLILLDQFPRNMFRGKAEAFSTDAKARELARFALARGYDLGFPLALRAFFYLPFMHSENLADQDLCVKLIAERLGTSSVNHPFALGHRDVIVRFGRFPMRNVALGRRSTAVEKAFIAKSSPH